MKTLARPISPEAVLAIIRIGTGFSFVIHGYNKIHKGPDQWLWLGQQLQLLGIDIWPILWGFLAALSEFAGGLLLTAGVFTRQASLFLLLTMVVATIYSATQASQFSDFSYPLSMLIIFLEFTTGPAENKHSITKTLNKS